MPLVQTFKGPSKLVRILGLHDVSVSCDIKPG